jgi:exodeoxyribonuclease X
MLNLKGADLLVAWSEEPGLLPRVPRGELRGTKWAELTDQQLLSFTSDRDTDIRYSAEREAARRGKGNAPAPGPLQGSLL